MQLGNFLILIFPKEYFGNWWKTHEAETVIATLPTMLFQLLYDFKLLPELIPSYYTSHQTFLWRSEGMELLNLKVPLKRGICKKDSYKITILSDLPIKI